MRLRLGRGVPRRAAGRRPRPLRDPRRATTAALLRGAPRARGAARARRGANGLLPAARHRRGALVARERQAGLRRRRQREARHQHDSRPDRPDAGERACAPARRYERAAGGIARLRGDPRARRRPAGARDRRLRARRPGRGRRRHPSGPDAPRRPRAGGAVARNQAALPARWEPRAPGLAGADERGAAPDRGRRHGRAARGGRRRRAPAAVRAVAAGLVHRRSLRRPRAHGRHALARHGCVRPSLHRGRRRLRPRRRRTHRPRGRECAPVPRRERVLRPSRHAPRLRAGRHRLLGPRAPLRAPERRALAPERAADRGSPRQDARGGDPRDRARASSRCTGRCSRPAVR